MKVTVCQLSNDPDRFPRDWQELAAHVRHCRSEFVLLPEMPFYPWLCRSRQPDPARWEAAVDAHRQWLGRLEELGAAAVAGTVPIVQEGRRLNEAFFWSTPGGCRPAHQKAYLPDEEGFWEASWYDRGPLSFVPVETVDAKLGFLICTEMWFAEHARTYGRAGVHLLLVPRATPLLSADKWLAGGRTAAVVSGAFCLSSCLAGADRNGLQWAGRGWVIEPEEGDILGLTSRSQPFITIDIDLQAAEIAKQTYPRYVRE
jgi:N-carbamoylputrescine amidase